MEPFPPAPGGGPIGVVPTILSIIGGLVAGSASSAADNVSGAISGLRDAISRVADRLLNFGMRIARWVGSILGALKWFKEHILDKVLQKLEALKDKIRRIYDRILKPYFDALVRMRQMILKIYDRFFRPWIEMIAAVRAFLAPFRVLGLKWARQLDARLARLEARIYAPIAALLERTASHDRWFNVLLSARYALQRPIFQRTLATHPRSLVNSFVNSMVDPDDIGAPAPPGRWDVPSPLEAHLANLRDALLYDAGPLHDEVQPHLAELRAGLSIGAP